MNKEKDKVLLKFACKAEYTHNQLLASECINMMNDNDDEQMLLISRIPKCHRDEIINRLNLKYFYDESDFEQLKITKQYMKVIL